MVCAKCTAKLGTVIVPDKWKEGALNVIDDTKGSNKAGDRRVGSNSLAVRMSKSLGGEVARPCRICKTKVQQAHAHYCSACAYAKGICAMCGHKVRARCGAVDGFIAHVSLCVAVFDRRWTQRGTK